MQGVPLERLLDGIVGVLVDGPLPAGPGPAVTGVAILDPQDNAVADDAADPADPAGSRDHHGELLLVIGVRGREALPLVRAAAPSGAVAVGIKADAVDDIVSSVAELGVTVLVVRPGARWDQLVMVLRERLEVAELSHLPGGPGPEGNDLFELAEDTARATGGTVTIEDASNRVLAYSRSDDDVDELRRLSILGWRGPEPYLRMLRDWGVFDRLRAGERVVRVDEHPELGIRPRLAVGIQAGTRYLGAIWVQRRGPAFAERAEEALIGAARLAAAEILRRRTGSVLGRGLRQELLVELLSGRASTDLVAGQLGLDPTMPALVVGFGTPDELDTPAHALHREQTLGLVSVYATAHHRHAVVGLVDERVYALLPGDRPGRVEPGAPSWVRHAVEVLRTNTGRDVCAGIGLPASTFAGLATARSEADRALDALLRGGGRGTGRAGGSGRDAGGRVVATMGELRSEVLLADTLDLLARRPELSHPGVRALAAHDAERGSELVSSVLAHLDALGDVRVAAAALNVHPNTLRYRLRRARELSGIDIDDPRERLACHLQLLLVGRELARVGAQR